jgi:hypothetical protein
MPSIRTPKKMSLPTAAAPLSAAAVAVNRVPNALRQAGMACLRVCMLIERQKAQGATSAEVEASLGLDAGDLKAHFDACKLVGENAGYQIPAWS